MTRPTRRQFVCAFGTAAIAGLAGCGGGGTETPTDSSLEGDEYPAVDRWLTETSVGGRDDSYDGTLADERGTDTVRIEVGASGNDGGFAYAPSAVVVSPGTTVRWVWTGDGGAHNVLADPEAGIGETDYAFDSGDPVAEADTEFTRTLDDPGVALYGCSPHLSLGMKGGIAVR